MKKKVVSSFAELNNWNLESKEIKQVYKLAGKLRYGNTNTFLIKGDTGNLLFDTDYAGTMRAFYKEIKRHKISLSDITNYRLF